MWVQRHFETEDVVITLRYITVIIGLKWSENFVNTCLSNLNTFDLHKTIKDIGPDHRRILYEPPDDNMIKRVFNRFRYMPKEEKVAIIKEGFFNYATIISHEYSSLMSYALLKKVSIVSRPEYVMDVLNQYGLPLDPELMIDDNMVFWFLKPNCIKQDILNLPNQTSFKIQRAISAVILKSINDGNLPPCSTQFTDYIDNQLRAKFLDVPNLISLAFNSPNTGSIGIWCSIEDWGHDALSTFRRWSHLISGAIHMFPISEENKVVIICAGLSRGDLTCQEQILNRYVYPSGRQEVKEKVEYAMRYLTDDLDLFVEYNRSETTIVRAVTDYVNIMADTYSSESGETVVRAQNVNAAPFNTEGYPYLSFASYLARLKPIKGQINEVLAYSSLLTDSMSRSTFQDTSLMQPRELYEEVVSRHHEVVKLLAEGDALATGTYVDILKTSRWLEDNPAIDTSPTVKKMIILAKAEKYKNVAPVDGLSVNVYKGISMESYINDVNEPLEIGRVSNTLFPGKKSFHSFIEYYEEQKQLIKYDNPEIKEDDSYEDMIRKVITGDIIFNDLIPSLQDELLEEAERLDLLDDLMNSI